MYNHDNTVVLYHYGVKGMKWGVRRKIQNAGNSKHMTGAKSDEYTDYGDGRITIKKGTSMQRLVGKRNKQDIAGITYASFTKYDNNSYIKNIAGKGPFGGGRNVKLSLKVTQDLKSPSTEEAGKIFFQMLKENPKYRDSYADSFLGKHYSDKELDELIKGDNKSKLKEEYGWVNSSFGLPEAVDVREAYFERLTKSGYNMLRDENDVISGYAKSPVIILDGAKYLEVTGKESIDDTMRKDSKSYVKMYKKYGEEWLNQKGFR